MFQHTITINKINVWNPLLTIYGSAKLQTSTKTFFTFLRKKLKFCRKHIDNYSHLDLAEETKQKADWIINLSF